MHLLFADDDSCSLLGFYTPVPIALVECCMPRILKAMLDQAQYGGPLFLTNLDLDKEECRHQGRTSARE